MQRRRFLQTGSAGIFALALDGRKNASAAPLSPLEQRLAAWEEFGWHWTGSSVQEQSANWLAHEASSAGMRCDIQTFAFQRVQVEQCLVQDAQHRSIGLPAFNHADTPASGLTGLLAVPPEAGDIALLTLAPQARLEEALAKAQAGDHQGAPYRAAVIVTTGAVAGLAPLDVGPRPMPLPVVQVGSDALGWLSEAAKNQRPVTLIARMTLSDGIGRNVLAVHSGSNQGAAPLVVSTGLSGWGPCTGERGGPLSIWLQIAAAMSAIVPERGVVMVAFDGEELGGLGRSAFLSHFADLAPNAPAWLELGANLGARDSALQLVAEDSPAAAALEKRLTVEDLRFARVPSAPEEVPARSVARLALRASPAPQFHLPGDQLPTSTDLRVLAALGAAIARGVAELATT